MVDAASASTVASSADTAATSATSSSEVSVTSASSEVSTVSDSSSVATSTTSLTSQSTESATSDSADSSATSTQDSSVTSAEVVTREVAAVATSSTKNGWVSENGTYTYYTNGKVASGENYSYLPSISGTGYNWYLVKDGVALSGVQKWYGSYYYFDPTTYLKLDHQDYVKSQWGDWYMVGSDGIVQSGVQKWYGKYYYFDPVTYLKLDHQDYVKSQWGDWYMVGSDGIVQSGVQKWYGKYYYFDPVTYLKLDHQDYVKSQWGLWYMVGSDGIVQSGVQKWYGKYYYFDPVTYLKLDHQDYVKSQWGDWYMVGSDGIVQSGLVQWYGHYYYFNPVTYLKATNTTFSYNGISLTADNTGIITGTTTSSQFLLKIYQATLDGWKEYGVLPSVTAAQAILESGWGQSALATEANNLFGIKGSYNGQYVIMSTAEYGSGGYYYVNAEFRKYPSFYESVVDHGYFLYSNSRYSNLLHQTSYATVTSLLQSDGYATSPKYASSLNNVITTYGLQSWDTAAGV
nr:glucosaminidase domain-containing protein [Limosilactobacillus fermentum]